MSRHSYLDATFEVWPSQQTWLWFVVGPLGGGTIGASATEAEAMADASSAIEETRIFRPSEGGASVRCDQVLAALDHYLTTCSAGPH